MADGIDEDSVILAASARIGTLLCAKRKHSAWDWVKQYIRERQNYGVFYTLLPKLAEKEVLKCMQYLRMDIHTFVLFVFGRVVPKFHYCDPTRPDQTLSATRVTDDNGHRPGSPTKSGRVAVVEFSLISAIESVRIELPLHNVSLFPRYKLFCRISKSKQYVYAVWRE